MRVKIHTKTEHVVGTRREEQERVNVIFFAVMPRKLRRVAMLPAATWDIFSLHCSNRIGTDNDYFFNRSTH
jgi:hypothetical protein